MNKLIRDQLNKCSEADLSNFDPTTNTYLIPKKVSLKISIGDSYLIELSKDALDINSVTNVNWNQCKSPTDKYYKVMVEDIKAKMIKVDGLAFDYENDKDLNRFWTGWLRVDSINILKKI